MLTKIKKPRIYFLIAFLIFILLLTAGCAGKSTEDSIVDITWQWESFRESETASVVDTPDPENYTLNLQPDGTFNMRADCNVAQGAYLINGSELTFEPGPSTMAFCGEESLDVLYLRMITDVARYQVEGGALVLELSNDAGEMTFQSE